MGFDNDSIVHIQSLAEEYFCPVCRTLVYPNEAIQSHCSHLFCKPCLAYIVATTRVCPYDGYSVTEPGSKPLIESNKALAESMSKILVHCLYHRSGCHWQGPLSECPTHSSGCPFGNCVVACSRCAVQIVHRKVQEHLKTCPGLNPQAQQVTDSNQTQTATQPGAPALQAQSQAGAAPIAQAQAANTAAQPNQEQHELQQQYYQFYQPGQEQYQHLYMQQQLLVQHLHQFQPTVQGHLQAPVYTHPQAQPRLQAPAQQHHQPQPYPRTHTQTYPRPQYHPPQLHPQFSPPVGNVQPQGQQPPPQPVPGHPPYPQVQPHQQMLPPPPPRQHTLHIPAQIHGQFPPPPPPQMLPPQSNTSVLNQQPQALLPSQGQVPNIPPAQQQQIHQHTQQQGHAVQQRPVMQQIQQSVPQQYALQPFPVQTGPVQNQLHQHTPFAPQQPMHSQLHPQGPPPQAMLQNYPAHLQPQQGVAVAHALHTHTSQPFSQSPGQFGVPSQVRPMQFSSNQTSGQQSQQVVQSEPSTKAITVERKADVLFDGKPGSPSQNIAEQRENSGGADSGHGGQHVNDKDFEGHAGNGGSGEPVFKETVKEEVNEGTSDSLLCGTSIQISPGEGKKVEHPVNDSSLRGIYSADTTNVSLQSSHQNVVPPGNIQSSHQNVVPPGNMQSSLVSSDDRQHSYQGTHHPRPGVPPMVQSCPHTGPPSNEHPLGYPPDPLRPQGPAHLSQLGQPLNPAEHYPARGSKQHSYSHSDTTLGGVPGSGSDSTVSSWKGPEHFGHLQRSLELQSSAPQEHHGQGHAPLQGAAPTGSTDPQGGTMKRAHPPHGHGGQFGQQSPINPMETDMVHNQRPHNFDSRHPDSHVLEYSERDPFGKPSGKSGEPRMDGAPDHSSSTIGLRDQRFKGNIEDRPNPFLIGQSQRFDKEEFEEGPKQFPRPFHLGSEASPTLGSDFSSSRISDRGPSGLGIDASTKPLDKSPRGSNYDAGLKVDSGYSSVHSRFLRLYHTGGALHPKDAGERAQPFGHNGESSGGRADSARTYVDFRGSAPGFARHPMEHLTPRSPDREHGISPRGLDIEQHSFGEGSRSFNLPPDQGGSSSRGSKFSVFPGHIRRDALGGPGNLRIGEHLGGELIGQDNPPSHLRGEVLGHHNLPIHLRSGEFDGPHHLPFGESFSGTKVSRPRLGEPGFRSSYSMHGFPSDGGSHSEDTSFFDQLRNQRLASMAWCRICEVDCETVEGLEYHSQTKDHQKMAMDIVIQIKQQNAKKQKTSDDHSRGDANKSRTSRFEGHANKP